MAISAPAPVQAERAAAPRRRRRPLTHTPRHRHVSIRRLQGRHWVWEVGAMHTCRISCAHVDQGSVGLHKQHSDTMHGKSVTSCLQTQCTNATCTVAQVHPVRDRPLCRLGGHLGARPAVSARGAVRRQAPPQPCQHPGPVQVRAPTHPVFSVQRIRKLFDM